ncbi:MAG: Gldg family protein [Oscillospiraceae bacterium]
MKKANAKKFLLSGASRQGTYAAGVTAVVIAIVVILNLIVGQLPASWKEFDLSGNQLYTISDTSKDYLSGLTRDVQILVLAEPDSVDSRITKFLDKYSELSDHITVTDVDPVSNPSALTQYNASANSLVVACADTGKQAVIPFTDIIVYDFSSYYYTGNYTESSFDAEGQITSAVDRVVRDSTAKVYTLEGHGETDLPSSASSLIEKANLLTDSVSLLSAGSVPDDCTLMLCYAPTKDLADDELTMLQSYLEGGGDLFLMLDSTDFTNFNKLLAEYGMTMVDGYIADATNYYRSAYNILPVCSSSCDLTSGLSSDALTLLTNARGMTLTSPARDTVTTSEFLSTSGNGYAIVGDSKTQGTYVLGATATETIGDGSGNSARLTVVTTPSLIDESITGSFSNVSNLDIFMNIVTADMQDTSNISIPSKSLSVTYNTVKNPGLWSFLFVLLIPLGVLAGGFVFWLKRRKL